MRFHFFTIPVRGGEEESMNLNRFLGEHRILAVDRQLVLDGPNSAWAICVSFDEGGSSAMSRNGASRRDKVDFKALFNAAEFAVFSRLRALRKERAEAEGVPAYALFTNEQLAEMVRRRIVSASALSDIPGVGPARVQKYGESFLMVMQQAALPEPVLAAEAGTQGDAA